MGRKRKPYNPAKVHDRKAKKVNQGQEGYVEEDLADDPYALEAGDKIGVIRMVRDDPLGRMRVRGHIDDPQYDAGRAFQADFEAAERGPKAMDPSKEYVDGGLAPEPITEGQRKAARRLAVVYRELGQDGSSITHDVLVHGLTTAFVAFKRGYRGKRHEDYFGMRFRECLNCMAKIYGFATEPTGKKRLVGEVA